jgi:hypothetical protein|tara:strand:+ start:5465 stop:5824 length:360 start_codon:yes stop_codon:yes gene_type:complete
MAKVNLDNRVEYLVGLSAKHIFKNLNKPLHKSWLASFTVRGHDRVDKCNIQFKEGVPEFVYSPSWLKKLNNSEGTFNGSDAIDHLSEIIKDQDGKMKNKRGRKRKVQLNISYHPPSINV